MIITCNNCNKNFAVDSVLIPENGRLLQCSGCNHKWFFKKETVNKPAPIIKINNSTEELVSFKNEAIVEEKKDSNTMELLDNSTVDTSGIEVISTQDSTEKKEVKNKKNYNVLGLTIVFIISFITLILVLDTFQSPISTIVPNIEFLLYSLYETIYDIVLFIRDLI